jgi:hypothetical protein
MTKQKINKDSLAAAKVRFYGEIRNLGLSQSKRQELLEEFERAYNSSLDYDLASNRVLEHLMAMKSVPTFKEALNSIGKKNNSLEKAFGSSSDKQKVINFIDKMFSQGAHENQITNTIIMEAKEQMGDKLDSTGIDTIRLWVLEEKVKLKIGDKNG